MPAAARFFAFTEQEILTEINRLSAPMQRVPVGQMRPGLRQLPFGGEWILLVNVIGQRELQHGIAEKLEPLIMHNAIVAFVSERRMGERFREQGRVLEGVVNRLLKFYQSHNNPSNLCGGIWTPNCFGVEIQQQLPQS